MVRVLALISLLLALPLGAEEDLVIAPRVKRPPLTSEDLARFKARLAERDLAKVGKATEELAQSGDAAALTLLNEMYETGDAQRRLLAVKAIGQLGVRECDEVLLKISVGDPFIAIRHAAAAGLKHGQAGANLSMLAGVVDSKANANTADLWKFRAIQAIARLGNAAAGEHLSRWLNHSSPLLASAAADGLGSLGDAAHGEALVRTLGSNNTELKPAAADALERISGERYRYDLVKWTEWLKTKGKKTAPENSDYAYDSNSLPPALYTDIVVVFDTTGSMTHIWPQLCNAIDAVLAQMIKQSGSLRMGLVLYRADAPELSMKYTIKPIELTRDHARVRALLDDATFGGGSGGVHLGLDYALKAMPWRAHARKVVILIGDTSPLPAGVQACARSIREAWEMDRILTTTLYVRSIHGDEHRQTYRLLASSGVGRFFEYNKAESHLVELSAEKVDVRQTERPEETARKWFLPRDK